MQGQISRCRDWGLTAVNPQMNRPHAELHPFRPPTGAADVLFGSRRRFPGKPFAVDQEEIV